MSTKKPFLFVSVLFLTLNLHAATYFVRSGASGNGTSWANAWSDVSSISWSSLNPGDTVCVAGGTYSGVISTGKSGSSGNPITIKRATAADPTCGSSTTGWNAAYDSQAVIAGISFANNYVTIDGGAWAGGTQWSGGFKITLANSDGSGIGVSGSTSNNTVRYIEVAGPCPSTGCNQNADTRGINFDSWSGSQWSPQTNWLVQYVNLHGQCTLVIDYNSPGLVFEHSRLADSMDETPGNPNCHPNVFELGGGTGITFRYNEVTNWEVEGIMTCPNGGCSASMNIYGNVWHDPFNGGSVARVLEAQGNSNGPYLVYNNTFANIGDTVFSTANGGSFAPGSQSENNIFWSVSPGSFPASDYNFSDSSISDAHGQVTSTSPFVNLGAHTIAGYHLASQTNAGINLGAPYNLDYDGNTRATWSRGAFEFSGSAATPGPPTGLKAQAQ